VKLPLDASTSGGTRNSTAVADAECTGTAIGTMLPAVLDTTTAISDVVGWNPLPVMVSS
jgi:hypothetical protein